MKQLMVFAAAWCGPCKALKQTLAGTELPVEVSVIDVDDNPNMVKEFGVRGVPTLVILEDGKVSRTKSGAMTKDQLLEFVGE